MRHVIHNILSERHWSDSSDLRHPCVLLVLLVLLVLCWSAAPLNAADPDASHDATRRVRRQSREPLRVWASRDGEHLRARLVEVDGDTVVLQSNRNRRYVIDLADLSDLDRRLIDELRETQRLQPEPPTQATAAVESQQPPSRPQSTSGKSTTHELPKAVRTLQRLLRENAEMHRRDGKSPLFGPNSSVYIAFSAKFLNEFIQVPIRHRRNVTETIMGTPVAGTADTEGLATLVLQPSPDHAAFDIVVKGRADSLTFGRQLLVQIESDGTTYFDARKRVEISTQGIDLYDATATARSTVNQSAVMTRIPGRVGLLVGRIAGSIVEANRAQIDYESSGRAAYRVAKDLDRKINCEVARVRDVLSEIAPGLAAGKPVIPIRFRTSSDRLAILVGEYEPPEWKEFDSHPLKEGEDIAVVLPQRTVSTVKQLQLALSLMSVSLEDHLGELKPEELSPKTQAWSDDREWLTLVWDVDGTVVELLSRDFSGSTALAVRHDGAQLAPELVNDAGAHRANQPRRRASDRIRRPR